MGSKLTRTLEGWALKIRMYVYFSHNHELSRFSCHQVESPYRDCCELAKQDWATDWVNLQEEREEVVSVEVNVCMCVCVHVCVCYLCPCCG